MFAISRKSLTALRVAAGCFRKRQNPSRLVYGVASLPLGVPVELELIFEVSA
jgi:hypothetical protein